MPIVPDDVATRAHLLTDHLGWWSTQKDIRRAVYRAIMGERCRCVEAVNAERIMDAGENPSDADPTDIAYDMAIDHAIDAIKRLST